MNNIEMLRIIADDYDQAQRVRVAKGEQIRAIAQGFDQQSGGEFLKSLGFAPIFREGKERKSAADLLLEAILRGDTNEPSEYLAWGYRAEYEKERKAFQEMSEALESHPVWNWMRGIRGVGPTLAAKLLSRLDIDKSHNGSSFLSYCGLGTVPGQRWHCAACGWVGIFPATYNVTGKHKSCKEVAELTHDDVDGIRAAQPRAVKGEKSTYDAFAKKTMYLLAMSWIKSGSKSFYNKVYRDKIAYYERERPGWEKGRKHYSALRAAEKMFLSHVYEVWCNEIGRDAGTCYAEGVLGHEGIISAEEAIEWEQRAR